MTYPTCCCQGNFIDQQVASWLIQTENEGELFVLRTVTGAVKVAFFFPRLTQVSWPRVENQETDLFGCNLRLVSR